MTDVYDELVACLAKLREIDPDAGAECEFYDQLLTTAQAMRARGVETVEVLDVVDGARTEAIGRAQTRIAERAEEGSPR